MNFERNLNTLDGRIDLYKEEEYLYNYGLSDSEFGIMYNIFKYFKDGKLHRVGAPAIITKNGTIEYFINNKRHRDDGPAIIESNNNTHYYKNGKLHRDDGPAFTNSHNDRFYYNNGRYHREDGPAIILHNGVERYYLKNKEYNYSTYTKVALKLYKQKYKSLLNFEGPKNALYKIY